VPFASRHHQCPGPGAVVHGWPGPLVAAGLVLLVRWADGTDLDAGVSRMAGLPDVGWLGVAAVALLIGGFGEEIGWRGFGWPRLRERRSLRSAALLIAVPWTIWHLPLFWIDSGMRGFPLVALPGFFFSLACGAVVLGWLFDRSASVAVVAVWHTMVNMATATNATAVAVPFVSIMVIVIAVWLLHHEAHSQPTRMAFSTRERRRGEEHSRPLAPGFTAAGHRQPSGEGSS
jgi:uncharacterized protein